MGFGYLLIGYLVSNILYLILTGMGFGGIGLLLGYALMLMGLTELCRYQGSFIWAKWLLLPLALCAIYDGAASIILMLGSNATLTGFAAFFSYTKAVGTVNFVFTVLFNLALLYAIRMIAEDVGLHSKAVSALRNMVIVGAYALLTVCGFLTFLPDGVRRTVTFIAMFLNLAWIFCNLVLLLSCNKDICRKGDEEVTPKRSRFEIFNRMSDTFARTRKETADSTREYTEEVLRRRKEKQAKKNKK